MKTTPLFSREFHIATLSKKRRSIAQRLADQVAFAKSRSLDQLSKCMAGLIPDRLLKKNEEGRHSRDRIFTKKTTFWAFLSQVINADGGCAEVVSKLRAFVALKSAFQISPSTGAYCSARKNLAKEEINAVFEHVVETLDQME